MGVGTYLWESVQYEDVDGIPGQGNKNPSSIFRNHAFVYISGRYYDPSYGVDYGTHNRIKTDATPVFEVGNPAIDKFEEAVAAFAELKPLVNGDVEVLIVENPQGRNISVQYVKA